MDIDPVCDKTDAQPDEPMGKTIPLTPGVGGSTWEPEQETSFGGMSPSIEVLKDSIKGLYQKLSEIKLSWAKHQKYSISTISKSEMELYYRDKTMPLMNKQNELISVSEIAGIFNKKRLHYLDFYIPVDGKVMALHAVMLNRVELPSTSDIAKADDIELQEITENSARSTEDLIAQLEWIPNNPPFEHPLCELMGLDKELRSI